MNRSATSLLAAVAVATAAFAQAPIATAPVLPQPANVAVPAAAKASRAIDLVICLDVSGSMQGLIDAARQNLWAVVNDLATLRPTPDLRVALLTYGCPEYGADTGFVRVDTALTNDLDTVSQKLFALTTNGGDEYVARVVKRALDELQWSNDPQALKLVFVAGNEPATQDPLLDAFAQSKAAIEHGIVVNAIYCGAPQHADADAWRRVAQSADGQFMAIDKDQAVVIATPFDEQLTALSAQLNTTYVPYGKQRAVWAANQVAQDNNATSLNPVAAAQRCQTKASALYDNAQWDLVDACKDAKFELAKVQKDDLPEDLRALSIEQLQAHVAAKQTQRAALQQQATELGKQRDAFVAAELAKQTAAGEKRFEQAVLESVREQAKARGFERKVDAPPPPPAAPQAVEGQLDPKFVPIVEQAVKGYDAFVRVTGQPKMAPQDCRMPGGPFALRSQADTQHGGKLYVLYARIAHGLDYVTPGEPAPVGQTLVKEAWECVAGPRTGPIPSSERYPPFGLTVKKDGGEECHAGAAHGLFVMHKLAPNTDGTDQGWVYGTIDAKGQVTGAGRMASCMRCHQDADNDRRFGLR